MSALELALSVCVCYEIRRVVSVFNGVERLVISSFQNPLLLMQQNFSFPPSLLYICHISKPFGQLTPISARKDTRKDTRKNDAKQPEDDYDSFVFQNI